jgi:penicillin V acylase-like amidase (Ntn superfamily)
VTIHLALEDATGDSAVIAYVGGKPRVHHGREYTVLTNSPPYDEQLKNLRQYKGFGGDKPLPGTTEAADRFVRGAYYLKNLPEPKDYRETVAGVLSVMRNVAQPFGTADPARPNISATRRRTVSDLNNLVYYFESATSPNIVWVKLKELDFSEGAAIRKLDLVKEPDRIGNCSKLFEPAEPFVVPPPDLK